jgi:hypothetical protein
VRAFVNSDANDRNIGRAICKVNETADIEWCRDFDTGEAFTLMSDGQGNMVPVAEESEKQRTRDAL